MENPLHLSTVYTVHVLGIEQSTNPTHVLSGPKVSLHLGLTLNNPKCIPTMKGYWLII